MRQIEIKINECTVVENGLDIIKCNDVNMYLYKHDIDINISNMVNKSFGHDIYLNDININGDLNDIIDYIDNSEVDNTVCVPHTYIDPYIHLKYFYWDVEFGLSMERGMVFDDRIGCLVIPPDVNGIDIVEIPCGLLNNINHIECVILPNGCCKIGDYAFDGCTGLRQLFIPDELVEIGSWAFYGCVLLDNLDFSGCGEMVIASNAFCECTGLTNIIFSNNMYNIGSKIFCKCTSLAFIALPPVMYLHNDIFDECDNLRTIKFSYDPRTVRDDCDLTCKCLTKNTIEKYLKIPIL